MKDLKAIFFDLDNTLLDRNAAWEQYLSAWLHKHGIANIEDELAILLQRDNWGYSSREDFGTFMMQRYGIADDPKTYITELVDTVVGMFGTISAEMAAMVAACRQHYTVGIITNGDTRIQTRKIDNCGIREYFAADEIIISQSVGFGKPSKAIFDIAISPYGLHPEQCLYVGDHPINDIFGAAGAGWHTCWVSGARTFPEDCSRKPDITIKSAEELAALIPF